MVSTLPAVSNGENKLGDTVTFVVPPGLNWLPAVAELGNGLCSMPKFT